LLLRKDSDPWSSLLHALPITVKINDILMKIWYEAFITTSSYDNYFLPLKTAVMKTKSQSLLQQPSGAACVWQPCKLIRWE